MELSAEQLHEELRIIGLTQKQIETIALKNNIVKYNGKIVTEQDVKPFYALPRWIKRRIKHNRHAQETAVAANAS